MDLMNIAAGISLEAIATFAGEGVYLELAGELYQLNPTDTEEYNLISYQGINYVELPEGASEAKIHINYPGWGHDELAMHMTMDFPVWQEVNQIEDSKIQFGEDSSQVSIEELKSNSVLIFTTKISRFAIAFADPAKETLKLLNDAVNSKHDASIFLGDVEKLAKAYPDTPAFNKAVVELKRFDRYRNGLRSVKQALTSYEAEESLQKKAEIGRDVSRILSEVLYDISYTLTELYPKVIGAYSKYNLTPDLPKSKDELTDAMAFDIYADEKGSNRIAHINTAKFYGTNIAVIRTAFNPGEVENVYLALATSSETDGELLPYASYDKFGVLADVIKFTGVDTYLFDQNKEPQKILLIEKNASSNDVGKVDFEYEFMDSLKDFKPGKERVDFWGEYYVNVSTEKLNKELQEWQLFRDMISLNLSRATGFDESPIEGRHSVYRVKKLPSLIGGGIYQLIINTEHVAFDVELNGYDFGKSNEGSVNFYYQRDGVNFEYNGHGAARSASIPLQLLLNLGGNEIKIHLKPDAVVNEAFKQGAEVAVDDTGVKVYIIKADEVIGSEQDIEAMLTTEGAELISMHEVSGPEAIRNGLTLTSTLMVDEHALESAVDYADLNLKVDEGYHGDHNAYVSVFINDNLAYDSSPAGVIGDINPFDVLVNGINKIRIELTSSDGNLIVVPVNIKLSTVSDMGPASKQAGVPIESSDSIDTFFDEYMQHLPVIKVPAGSNSFEVELDLQILN